MGSICGSKKGELVVVLGPNEMGKSTLLAVMGGVLQPQHGYVEINGLRRRRSVEEEREILQTTVYLPDQSWLPATRTGREFLMSVGRLYDLDDDRLMDHVDRLLELFELADRGLADPRLLPRAAFPSAESAYTARDTLRRSPSGLGFGVSI